MMFEETLTLRQSISFTNDFDHMGTLDAGPKSNELSSRVSEWPPQSSYRLPVSVCFEDRKVVL